MILAWSYHCEVEFEIGIVRATEERCRICLSYTVRVLRLCSRESEAKALYSAGSEKMVCSSSWTSPPHRELLAGTEGKVKKSRPL